jgi:Tol biopolymer transport system component
MRRVLLIVGLVVVVTIAGLYLRFTREVPLPPDVRGTLVYLSDRGGADTLYARVLPEGTERRLTYFTEAVRDPALSRDGSRIAFSVGGRIGIVVLATGDVRLLTFGIDYRDVQPAWRADGQALAVVARRPGETAGDIHLLAPLDPGGGRTGRAAITLTRGLDESEPALSPDGTFVVFVREDNLVRQELANGRTRRLTGGFRKTRQPLFLPGGRILCLWALEKQFGIDVMEGDGKNRTTLGQGTTYYRSVTPSPDGRFFAATFTYDLRFHPALALRPRHVEEVHLLDAHGVLLAPLVRSFRDSNHSPQWAR